MNGWIKMTPGEFEIFNQAATIKMGHISGLENYTFCLPDKDDPQYVWVRVEDDYFTFMTPEDKLKVQATGNFE